MRIHIFGDQHRDATGVFYKAFGYALARACADRGCLRPGVHFTYVELGNIENYPNKVASQVYAKCLPGDLVVLVWDTEDRRPELTAQHLGKLKDALAGFQIGEDRVHIVLAKPTTEAVYLLDDAMLEVLITFRTKQRAVSQTGPDGKRRRLKQGEASDHDIRALAQRRRAYAKHKGTGAEAPSKAEVLGMLAIRDEHKARLARLMEKRLGENYQLPKRGAVPVLDGLLDWLVQAMAPKQRQDLPP